MLKAPKDIFASMEAIVLATPRLLQMDNYHTASNGHEAIGEEQVEHPATAHCVLGWVIRLTPEAISYENGGTVGFDHGGELDPLDLAQWVLERGGHMPVPLNVVYGTINDAMRFIRGRAAEYRESLQSGQQEASL